jgi:hypothetical protein
MMGKPFEEKPDTWVDWAGKVFHAGDDIYYSIIGDGIKVGDKAHNVWVWHWHRPTKGVERWALSACGLHDVRQVEPLTLDPSLACEDGCPSHGYIKNGSWRAV